MVTLTTVTDTGRRVVTEFSQKNVTLMAAGIAYNAFVSLVPMLLLLLLVVSVVGGGLEDRLVDAADGSLPGPIADTITQIFQGGSTAAGASVVGLVVLIWGSLKIFRSLDTAFSEIYETEAENGFLDQVRDGLVVLGGLVAAIVATVLISVAFAAFADTVPYVGVLAPLVLVVGLVLAFFPMYYLFPDRDLTWRQVAPGVVFAAVGWALLQSLFQVYLVFKGDGSTGFLSGVVVIVTWLYFSGLVLLLGAVINAVVGGHASGEAGGVGRGAAARTPDRTRTMNRADLATYLGSFRDRLTDDGRRTSSPNGMSDSVTAPTHDTTVEVEEYSTAEDGETEWAVVVRWRTPNDEREDSPR
ncbi:YhjD/YihY/BrkB family envelope integrity protein [Halomarina salina]|uniref:YhjD/YihY/BrkB family envelope integrity protein n=1 Tax=Halomarina salina TaxID=1872699 RepID=A0ABD5RR96_9EURY|nr:YhjD/YihY/BrkB family envelope integrity protein [Halomarina salina]